VVGCRRPGAEPHPVRIALQSLALAGPGGPAKAPAADRTAVRASPAARFSLSDRIGHAIVLTTRAYGMKFPPLRRRQNKFHRRPPHTLTNRRSLLHAGNAGQREAGVTHNKALITKRSERAGTQTAWTIVSRSLFFVAAI